MAHLYILSHPRLTISSRPLAQAISKIVGEEIIVSKVPLSPRRGNNCIIRYGNSTPIEEREVNFNHPDHIRLAGNKLALSRLLTEKDFSHVELYDAKTDIFPIVARTELNRGGGIGIAFCENQAEFKASGARWWSYFYPFSFELGVHILGGKIVKVFKKVREEGLPEEKFPRRNTNNGYKFSLRENWKENYSGLVPFVEKLYKIVPISFARLDIGYDKQSGGYKLIEINSAPDLSKNKSTLEMYAEYLAKEVFRR